MRKIYIIPNRCPVDNDEVIILASKKDKTFIFYCSLCNNAWEDLDNFKINKVEDVAPAGVRLPTSDEVEHFNNDNIEIKEIDLSEMYGSLNDILQSE